MTLLRRIALRVRIAVVGYFLATIAAAAVMALVLPILPGGQIWMLPAGILLFWPYVVILTFFPAVLTIYVTESLRLRSAPIFIIAGGLTGVILGYKFSGLAAEPGLVSPLPRDVELTGAAGSVAGWVYWRMAGRSAGG